MTREVAVWFRLEGPLLDQKAALRQARSPQACDGLCCGPKRDIGGHFRRPSPPPQSDFPLPANRGSRLRRLGSISPPGLSIGTTAADECWAWVPPVRGYCTRRQEDSRDRRLGNGLSRPRTCNQAVMSASGTSRSPRKSVISEHNRKRLSPFGSGVSLVNHWLRCARSLCVTAPGCNYRLDSALRRSSSASGSAPLVRVNSPKVLGAPSHSFGTRGSQVQILPLRPSNSAT